MVSYRTTLAPVQRVEDMICLIRGQRVMLDSDLARICGVTTKRLKEQYRRNARRFPGDFVFEAANQELANLIEAIRQWIEPPLPEVRPKIGFMRETAPRYRFRRICRK